MNDFQKETITKLVHTFASKTNISNQEGIDDTINRLYPLNVNDAIDYILVSLNYLLGRKLITYDEILKNVQLILELNPEKYSSDNDLIDRLNCILDMNIEHPNMSLTENYQLIIEILDSFNKMLDGKFDCYYTGGTMGVSSN